MGTIRTAYFNWLAAKASDGRFIVRIDDTDQARSDQKWADQFLDTLRWLGLDWAKIYYQSHRLGTYQLCANGLVDMGLAVKDGDCVRLNLSDVPTIQHWTDELVGDVKIQPDNLKGFDKQVLIKTDGYPTYHFASCVDDITMGVNFVIRGVDHITNTARHVLLYKILDAALPKFAHVGLLRTKAGKLTKRDATSNMQTYIDQGIDPDAMLNFLARLGWGPTVDNKTTKILPKAKMVDLFIDGGKMLSRDANVDFQKLASFDRKYKGRKASGEKF
jgi:glutamyl-tRNA synthetase